MAITKAQRKKIGQKTKLGSRRVIKYAIRTTDATGFRGTVAIYKDKKSARQKIEQIKKLDKRFAGEFKNPRIVKFLGFK